MAGDQVIKFDSVPWCSEAAEALAPLVMWPQSLDDFRSSIDAGVATLWRVTGDGWSTWLVTHIESSGCCLELVLDVIDGSHSREIVARLIESVKPLGVRSVRFETHHAERVAARLVGGLGFERVASIFRVNLDEQFKK